MANSYGRCGNDDSALVVLSTLQVNPSRFTLIYLY